MAIYSLNLGFISRSEGRSAVGFSAYISGGRHQDERTGVIYDYGCKSDVIVSRILAPEDAPEWVKNSSILWNKMESLEDEYAALRFRGDSRDPEKNKKSLRAKEQFLNSAQPAQTIMGAIPIEFSKEEAEVCVEEFLRERFVPRGLVVEYAIHWQRGNPHFHGMITRRALIDGDPRVEGLRTRFSQKKDRDIVSKAEHNITRKMWEVVVNKHLELGGHEVRIDSRSYADRGSLFLPLAHEGWYAQRLAEKGKYSRIVADNDIIRQKNIEILCENPAALIQEVSLKRATFTRKHLEDEIIRRVGGDEKLFALLKAKVEGVEIPSELILKQANDNTVFEGTVGSKEAFTTHLKSLAVKLTDQLLENKDLTYEVGENINRNRIFTSKTYKDQEEKLIGLVDSLHQKQTKVISEEGVTRAIERCEAEFKFSLSKEQHIAIQHLCSGPDIRILNGKAGTGKTTLLKAVAQAYQDAGYSVRGTSFQGKAVEIMEQEIGIPCRTLDSFDYSWKKHELQKELVESGRLWGRPYLYAFQKMQEYEKSRFTSKDVIIVDEANMVGGHLWEVFLHEVVSKDAKVLIVQDPAQIKSRKPGDFGRLFAERFGCCETREVVRQRITWQRECSKLLNDHHVLDGVKPYYDKGYFKWFEDSGSLHHSLAQDYVNFYLDNPQKTLIALAYRNSDVYAINRSIRQVLKDQGYLKECFQIHGEEYALGDRIRFTQNDHHGHYVQNIHGNLLESLKEAWAQSQHKGVKNGTFGTIEAYNEEKSLLTVCLEDKKCPDNKREVQFNTKDYPHITHGYAMGVHKSEGNNFDKSLVALDPLMDPETFLVALTRHRDDTQIYVNRGQFIDFKAIIDKIGHPSFKDTLQDYHITEDQRPYFTRVQQYRDLIVEAVILREEMEGGPRWDSGASLKPTQPFYKHPSYSAYQTLFEEKKRIAATMLEDWQNHLPYVRLAGIRRDILEVEAGLRPRLLSDLEHRASIQVQEYMDLVKETRSLWKTISEPKAPTHSVSLAKFHPLYEDYKLLKAERDSLAAVFQENLKLYTPFLRVIKNEATETYKDYWGEEVTKETRVYISSIKSHAEAHQRSQMQNLYYERLNPDQKTHYDLIKFYVDTRNETAAIYSHLQKQKESHGQALLVITSPDTFFTFEKFHQLQAKRDELALKIIETPEHYLPYFDVLKVKEGKLLDHAVSGEVREKVQAYAHETEISKRASKAEELKRILTTSKDYRIFKEGLPLSPIEGGLDFNRLTFDIAFYDKIKSGEISNSINPEDVFKPIQRYLNSSKEAARLWKIIQLKPQDKKREPTEALHKDWQLALTARNENANILINDQVALSVISGMRQGIQTQLMQQAKFSQRNIWDENDKTNKANKLNQTIDKTFQKSISVNQTIVSHISKEQVLEAAHGNYTSIITDLLGPPNKHMGGKTALRFGQHGSFLMNIAGPKEGHWKDFETGETGDIFHLIQREKNMSFKEVVGYLADLLNVKSNVQAISRSKTVPSSQKQSTKQASLDEAKDIAQRLNAVSELQMKSKAIENTIAETYLRKERGILGPLALDVRFIPKGTTFIYQGERKTLKHDCFAAFGRDHEGRLSSVQLIKLDEQGKRAITKEGEKLNKIQYGISKGSFVTLQEEKNTDRILTDRALRGCVFIAEGIETALSIKEANVKGKIVASMGIHNISNYQGPEKEIIICADNDDHKPNSQTHKIIKESQEHFKSQDKSVITIKPSHPGDDFNDVLKKQGTKGIQEYVKGYHDPSMQKVPAIPEIKEVKMTPADKPRAIENQLNAAKPDSNTIETLFNHLESKIKEIKVFEGSSLADQAKRELETYITILGKDETRMQELRNYKPELAKDIEGYIHNKKQGKSLGMDR